MPSASLLGERGRDAGGTDVSLPVPPAPEGYPEPFWKGDQVDVLVVIDRTDGFEPLDGDEPLTHPIDVFVGDLR